MAKDDDGARLTQAQREAEPGFEDEVAAGRAENNGHGDPDAVHPPPPAGEGDGETLEDRTNGGGDPATATADDGQEYFVWEHGRKVTFGNLIKRGTDVEYRVKFGGISVKGRGEPVPLEAKNMNLIGRYISGGLNFVPTHDDEGNVEKVTIYATLKPTGAPTDVTSPEARLILGNPSLADAVNAELDDGVTADYIRKQVEELLAAR
jgi:hypothetical protein